MTVLAQADITALLEFVGESATSDGTLPFSTQAIRGLQDLVHADWVVFAELDRVRLRAIALTTAGGVMSIEGHDKSDSMVVYWDIRHEHPVCSYHERIGEYAALRVSDFMSRRQLHGSRLYREWFQQSGHETEMSVGLDAPKWHTKVFVIRRASGDFSERDRTVLEALRPMLGRLYEAGRSRHRLASAVALMADHAEAGGPALVILNGARRPDFVSGAAQSLFARLGAAPGRLPEAVEARLNRTRSVDPGDPLVVPWQGGELIVHRSGEALLFEERLTTPSLTAREREILELVAQGQTNAQIAVALFISPGTVRRHLENAFDKLGVHTRTAAVASLAKNATARPA